MQVKATTENYSKEVHLEIGGQQFRRLARVAREEGADNVRSSFEGEDIELNRRQQEEAIELGIYGKTKTTIAHSEFGDGLLGSQQYLDVEPRVK